MFEPRVAVQERARLHVGRAHVDWSKAQSVGGEFLAERGHLREGVLIACAVCRSNSVVETGDGELRIAVGGKGLGRHLVGGNVIGVGLNATLELRQCLLNFVLADELHGEAVAGEGVVRVGGEDLREGGELVHGEYGAWFGGGDASWVGFAEAAWLC